MDARSEPPLRVRTGGRRPVARPVGGRNLQAVRDFVDYGNKSGAASLDCGSVREPREQGTPFWAVVVVLMAAVLLVVAIAVAWWTWQQHLPA